MTSKKIIGPASLPQQTFLNSEANIIVYGGAAGGGKSFCGLLRHARYINDPDYRGYVIRRQSTTLNAAGGLFDEARSLYKQFVPECRINKKDMTITFPSGAVIGFKHLDTDEDAEKWRGLQVSGALLDEATQIEEQHVFMILSRLRTKAKMKPFLAMTCNPDPDCYLRRWIDWWILPKGHENAGRPDPDRDGKIRWFITQNNELIFADTKEELEDKYGKNCLPLSMQFVSATIFDNPPLLKANPGYLATLQQMPRVKKERELYGNWDIREERTGYWKAGWCEVIHIPPDRVVKRVRAWDISGTLPSETNRNPDYTVGTAMSKDYNGRYYVEDVVRGRWSHAGVLETILATAERDGRDTLILLPVDPGAAGKAYYASLVRAISEKGYYVRGKPTNKSKVQRFAPFASACEAGLVAICRGEWNDAFTYELEGFDGSRNVKDDIVDTVGDGYHELASGYSLPMFAMPDLSRNNPFKS